MVRWCLLACTLGSANPGAHPMHTTFTEIVQTTAPGIVTITIRGFEDDLTTAARAGTPRGSVEAAIAGYLDRKVALTDARGRRIPLALGGTRRTAGVVWFTFQSLGPADLTGGWFVNTALTELFGDQVNLVQVKLKGRTRTLLFTPGDAAKAISGS